MMNSSSPAEGGPHSNNSDVPDQNITDWVDYIVAYFIAIQRYSRISFLHLHADRKESIESRSTSFLPLAGMSLAFLLTILLALTQFFWPLAIAVLLIGSLELVFLRTFVPESIPLSRTLLVSQKSSTASGNIFVLTILFMLLRIVIFYQLFSDVTSILTPCILILTSISLGTWIVPFSISFATSHDETARWLNPNRPLSKKQLGYASLCLIPLFLLGFWASLHYLAPALLASALVIYWIMRKLEDRDIEVTDTHIEGLASLFQIIFLLVCTIDFSFLKELSE
ncbi:MAG: hypothetical protein K0U86_11930 [Planctomycetes bacterium]|nr:hypothetical protein [Planctomycetota bacterium]MCH9725593.1 hypothetical protein [Planctomycetota bacterium]MCH9777647.1 hypothetical protein [Planctomycetota bacterium]MDF1743391.1 hypothetical protein [Gimesia sp.]